MKPDVSVIVPIYNVERYLKQCVNSIQRQTLKNIEIILVDDGSPDQSPNMCDRFAQEDKRIRVIHQENSGVAAARNRGVQVSEADWIMFVDSDDWLEENAIEVLYRKALTLEADIVCASHYKNFPKREVYCTVTVNGNGEYSVDSNLEFLFGCAVGQLETRTRRSIATPWGKIYRSSIIKENDILFPSGLKGSDDLIFNLYAIRYSSKVYLMDAPVYHYRIIDGTITRNLTKTHVDSYRRIQKELKSFMSKFHLSERFQPYYDFITTRNITTFAKLLGANVNDYKSFCEKVDILKAYSQEQDCKDAISNTSHNFSTRAEFNILLWLLKHHMYGIIISICYLYNMFF